MKYRVTSPSLNLRDLPATQNNSKILIQIPFRHTVKLIEKTTPDWWKVKLLNTEKEGFVFYKDIEAVVETNVKSIDIEIPNFELSAKASLNNKEETYKPIDDTSIPFRDLTSTESKLISIGNIIKALDVSNSFRYQKDASDTYCNIYTFDYCFFAKVYIPRLRWTDKAIAQLEKGNEVALVFDDTVKPFYSNYIYDWFIQSGNEFGWVRIEDVDELQKKVNANGGVGIICAKRLILNKSGHIVVVVPETDTYKAYRKDGKVIYPLQSQAGADNYNYFSEIRKDWWNNKEQEKGYASAIFYYHD
ncbi:SH3 domain-containing protein [Flavobacterium sp. LB2R40]|uniref:SH3 domain-containing protein n=1 Tax=unclassified Flavobacterium TaxID=196869 RepID=UPI003AAD09DD